MPHPIRRANFAKHRTSLGTALRGVVPALGKLPTLSVDVPKDMGQAPRVTLDPSLTPLRSRLEATINTLAGPLAGRNQFHVQTMRECEAYLTLQLQDAGLHVSRQVFASQGLEVANLHAEVRGSTKPEEIIVFGAHYDSIELTSGPCPAANDNGSGVAAVLAMARALASGPSVARTIRLSLWVNEEPPFFYTNAMGSLVDANACKARGDQIVGMLTPETLGFYSDEMDSQRYPLPGMGLMLPTTGNFVAFVGLDNAKPLVRHCLASFRPSCPVPALGATLPGIVPLVGASDHWSFWRNGYPALMITDTAPFRYRHYHTPHDTPEKIDFTRYTQVVAALEPMLRSLASAPAI